MSWCFCEFGGRSWCFCEFGREIEGFKRYWIEVGVRGAF